jgi:acetoin utilization deacetylase AcuC-like enzyme
VVLLSGCLYLLDSEYSDVIILGAVVHVIEDVCGGYCIGNNIAAAAADTNQI